MPSGKDFPLVQPDYLGGGHGVLGQLRTGEAARNYDLRVTLTWFVQE